MSLQFHPRIHFRFDEAKATQVATFLVERGGNSLSHLMLMKMLYIIDREALEKWERPVIGGRYCSMKYGTIISQVLDLMRAIEGVDEPSLWTEHLTKIGNEMRVVVGGKVADLSPAEIKLIEDVFNRFGSMGKWELCDLTHSFPEWENVGSSSKPIKVEKMLAAVGKTEDDIRRVADEISAMNRVDELIGV